jgi:hypothetical protein
MPRIPTIFDDALIDTFEQLFKTAQTVDDSPAPNFLELTNKLIDNLITEANNIQAPTSENLESPDKLIEYLRENNIRDANNNPLVYSQKAQGYVLYKAETYINVAGLQALLSEYKAAASQQKDLQGQYFTQAIDNLVSSLKATKGFQSIDVLDASKPDTAQIQRMPQTASPGSTTQQPGQSQPEQAVAQQKDVAIQKALHYSPLPENGQGMFNVMYIQKSMGDVLTALQSSSLFVREIQPQASVLQDAYHDIYNNASAFISLSRREGFSIGSEDQLVKEIEYIFNPQQQSSSPGDAAAARAMNACYGVALGVQNFYAALTHTDLYSDYKEEIDSQILAATTLQATFQNVSNQLAMNVRHALQNTGNLPGGYNGGNYS